MVEFTPRTGAISYDLRRADIDAEREAKGEMPILDDEFMSIVYDPCEPAVIELQEESTDQPPSPCTQKEHDQKDLIAAVQVRPPKKGKIILQPQSTVGELLGAREAVQWVSSQKKTSSHDVPDKIYQTMSKILDEVRQMVCSFPMHEVKKSDLDTCVRELAAAAFPDPSQHSLQSHYVRAANGLLRQILKDNDKVIEEETVPGKELLIPVGDLGGGDHHTEPDNEEIDRDADMFPLF